MSRNVSDVYSKLPGSVAVSGATVDSSDYNDQIDDIVNALNDVAMLSGSKPFTGDQSMGSHKLTSVTDGTAAQDAATVKQVQNAVVQHSTAVAGTADAIQVTFVPASTSLTTNEVIRWKSGGANTVTGPTISKDAGSTNKTIKKGASAALAVGDTGASGYECEAIYNGTDWILQNPATDAATSANVTAIAAGKKAIWIDAGAMRPKVTNGAGFSDYDSGTNDFTLRCADFDTTTQEYAHFKMAMPDIWNESTVTFKPYWTNTAGLTTETVVFSLAGAAFSNDDGINGTAFGTVQTSTDTWLAQNDLHVGPESSAITIAGTPAAGDLVVFEVSRVVGSDTMTGDARLIGLMLYITTNAFNEP